MMKSSDSIIPGIQRYFLVGMCLLLLVILFLFATPFLSTLFIAAVIATAVYPFHRWIDKNIQISETLSAFFTLVLVTTLVLGPLVLIFFAIVGQAGDAYTTIDTQIVQLMQTEYPLSSLESQYPWIAAMAQNLWDYTPISSQEILSVAGSFIGEISKFLLKNATNILRQLTVFIIHAVIFFLALFYFIRDGGKFVSYVRSILPLEKEHREELFHKMYRLTHSIIYGIFGAAVAQGLLLWVALTIVGINNALFWSAIGTILAILPYIGISLVWIPVAIYLFFNVHIALAVFFTAWCVGVVSIADNIVKPYVIGVKSFMHPLAVLVMILGGFFAFGIQGLILGPFVLMLALAFLEIFRKEYKKILQHKG